MNLIDFISLVNKIPKTTKEKVKPSEIEIEVIFNNDSKFTMGIVEAIFSSKLNKIILNLDLENIEEQNESTTKH